MSLIEFASLNDLVADSNTFKENKRTFNYNLKDKNIKNKLIKGAKIEAFNIEEKSCSVNLIFSVGSWAKAVLPTITYLNNLKGKSCKAGNNVIKIQSVDSGTEKSSKQVDTIISFTVNEEKAVAHLYHTTQLIMINGPGYRSLAYEFLAPFFESKIGSCVVEIELFNKQTLDDLHPSKPIQTRSTVMRSKISKVSGVFSCSKCSFSTKSVTALAKHSKNEHISESITKSNPIPLLHSTRNNSISEALLQENITISGLISDDSKAIEYEDCRQLKFTCKECNTSLRTKVELDKHVEEEHITSDEELLLVCSVCEQEFNQVTDYHSHVVTHDIVTSNKTSPDVKAAESTKAFKCTFCNFTCGRDFLLDEHIVQEHKSRTQMNTDINGEKLSCPFCNFVVETLVNLKEHIVSEPTNKCNKCDATNTCKASQTETDQIMNHTCKYCNEKLDDENSLKVHMKEKHEGIVLFNRMAKQIHKMDEKLNQFEDMKNEMKSMLVSLTTGQNDIKTELSLLRSEKPETTQEDTVQAGVKAGVTEVEVMVKEPIKDPKPRNDSPNVAPSRLENVNSVNSKNKKNVMWVGTSITKALNCKQVEQNTNTSFDRIEVYGIRRDNQRLHSDKNLVESVNKALETTQSTDVMVLESGSKEISDIDVVNALNDKGKHFENYKKEWIKQFENDSKTVLNVAETALKEGKVKDVIVVKRLPRFDLKQSDPVEIKRELSDHANKYYEQMWEKQGCPNNIHIVSIPLGTEESLNLKRIIHGSSDSRTFDGIHLNGYGASRHLNYRTIQVLKPILGN